MPALLTNTSMRFHVRRTLAIAVRAARASPTSATTTRPRPPASRTLSATSFNNSRRRATSATRAPRRPNSSAVSRPIPLDAPVTTTTRPRIDPSDGMSASRITKES
jgi:hypothetical protein